MLHDVGQHSPRILQSREIEVPMQVGGKNEETARTGVEMVSNSQKNTRANEKRMKIFIIVTCMLRSSCRVRPLQAVFWAFRVKVMQWINQECLKQPSVRNVSIYINCQQLYIVFQGDHQQAKESNICFPKYCSRARSPVNCTCSKGL